MQRRKSFQQKVTANYPKRKSFMIKGLQQRLQQKRERGSCNQTLLLEIGQQ